MPSNIRLFVCRHRPVVYPPTHVRLTIFEWEYEKITHQAGEEGPKRQHSLCCQHPETSLQITKHWKTLRNDRWNEWKRRSGVAVLFESSNICAVRKREVLSISRHDLPRCLLGWAHFCRHGCIVGEDHRALISSNVRLVAALINENDGPSRHEVYCCNSKGSFQSKAS